MIAHARRQVMGTLAPAKRERLSPGWIRAGKVVLRALRRAVGLRRLRRASQLWRWRQLKSARRFIRLATFGIALLYSSVMLSICAAYTIQFSAPMASAWMQTVGLSLLLTCGVTEPLTVLVRWALHECGTERYGHNGSTRVE